MVKFGIISDTHVSLKDDSDKIKALINQLKEIFKDVDEIIHAGDVCEHFFLDELKKIAPTICVKGNEDKIKNLKKFIKFSVGNYNIGVIHEQPEDLENFFKKNDLHVLILGHSHQPLIKGTPFNTLILNPGSPTRPKAPPKKKGFSTPIARPSVLTLKIDDKNVISTFLINLKS